MHYGQTPRATLRSAWTAALLIVGCTTLAACEAAVQPDHFRIVELEGTPYERGVTHGERFRSEIRSLYTQMMTSSLLPYLNRERPDIEEVLTEYGGELYDDGQFSYQLMLQSALNMEPSIPEEYIEEMHGIADGAELPYEQVLVMNTFLDTMLSLRSITFFIRGMDSPYVVSVEFDDAVESDGVDNDGDGEVDEEGEGRLDPYSPSPLAAMTEVPSDSVVRFLLLDQGGAADVLGLEGGAEPEGVDPASIKVQIDTEVFLPGDPEISTRPISSELGELLEVSVQREGGFEPESVVSLLISAGDLSNVTDPPPPHARFMRDERVVFTTEGYGAAVSEVESRGEDDGRTLPPAIAFAARDTATAAGDPLMAHHFALLDANTSHKHTVLFVHDVDEGTPHVTLGWTGLIWGFAGMNTDGLSLAINSSDTLDNGMVVDVIIHMNNLASARLVGVGIPVGMLARQALSSASTVDEASAVIEEADRTFGWNFMLVDSEGGMLALETDSDILGVEDGGFRAYSATDEDEPWARSSVGPDDLRLASHYVANTEDMDTSTLMEADFIQPQRFWSSFYYRSMRAYYLLGDQIEGAYGDLDVPTMIEIMREPALIDPRDSMSAVVFEPAIGRLHVAMGQVPATDGEFRALDIEALVEGGGR